ncbi:hypothetical protein FWK35_00034842 [Aphis craccivora]|uniref:Uncharacterized protein n=1 Tax=Aphis craccivora TaxID=307492 RepID=A0A6G0WSP3_APHCR|nr:hypothetical protein FWK35_00034842 [Aphis craccivora]
MVRYLYTIKFLQNIYKHKPFYDFPTSKLLANSRNFGIFHKKLNYNAYKKKFWEFLRKTSFRPNRFFYMVVIQKLITINI